jgi:hypothetical protein
MASHLLHVPSLSLSLSPKQFAAQMATQEPIKSASSDWTNVMTFFAAKVNNS